MFELPSYIATRYVQPLREGGSLPAVLDTDGGGLFVTKFRGAGQGAKALIAELIVGTLARAAELPTPDLALIAVPSSFGRSEPDPEIQDLLRASHGMNVGLRYLDGAFNFDPVAAGDLISPELAARIVWLDAFVTNPDRTHRNSNLLVWNRQPWLIDHGAALYAHHDWPSVDDTRTHTPFPFIRDHVLLARSADLESADASLTRTFASSNVIREAVAVVPDALLDDPAVLPDFATPQAARERYVSYLEQRLNGPHLFLAEAVAARERALSAAPRRVSARR
ncbi:MAG: HipA family kinase [Gemmatimonadaceae bacterium]